MKTVPVDAGWGSSARDQKGWLSDRTLSGVPGVVCQAEWLKRQTWSMESYRPTKSRKEELQGTLLGTGVERFMKSYNITLSEAELLDVVTALDVSRMLRRGPVGSASLSSTRLSRRIADQAAEQFHDVRLSHDTRQQLSLPYGPLSEWPYVYYEQG